MKKAIRLGVLLGALVLIGSVCRASVINYEEFFPAQNPNEEIEPERLERLVSSYVDPGKVFDMLTRARSKSSTQFNGVNVDELLKLGSVAVGHCHPDAFKRRVATCHKLRPWQNLLYYCRFCMIKAAVFCLRGETAKTLREIGLDNHWMEGLRKPIADFHSNFTKSLQPDEIAAERFIRELP
jgi:hypothetical protein